MIALKPLLIASFTLFSICEPPWPLALAGDHQKIRSFSLPNRCSEKCGNFNISFPFHLNASCFSVPDAFRLSCVNSTTLFLQIGAERYRVLEFFADGVTVDFPNSSVCREYQNLNAFNFAGNDYFGISADNIVGLYDCEDSSLCKAGCETNDLPGCRGEGGGGGGSVNCCYPLSDHSVWRSGDGFSVFSKFGCRGFSSWVVPRGSSSGERGVKLEWAIPRNVSGGVCAGNASVVNATAVAGGVRCSCNEGFVGDGFTNGVGCLKSCIKNGEEAYGAACDTTHNQSGERKLVIVAGVLAPLFVLASLAALCCLLKRPGKEGIFGSSQSNFHSSISFRKACRTRFFTYQELEEATKGFEEAQKLSDGKNGPIHAGVLADGSHIAVHKLHCNNERGLIQILSKIELLSVVSHRNLARVLGCCVDSGYSTAMIVYEYLRNGTLEEHLHPSKGHNFRLDWCKRLELSAETASILAYLQCEITPPIYHHDVNTSYIFLDEDSSARIAGFLLLQNKCNSLHLHSTDVYNFGVMLLEIISGCKQDTPTVSLRKIRSGKLEEVLDPSLYYHEQPIFRREQIEIVADIATRCMLFGGDGKVSMTDVARELVHLVKESADGCSQRVPALEETFSNSSLLQMISMSPDSLPVP